MQTQMAQVTAQQNVLSNPMAGGYYNPAAAMAP